MLCSEYHSWWSIYLIQLMRKSFLMAHFSCVKFFHGCFVVQFTINYSLCFPLVIGFGLHKNVWIFLTILSQVAKLHHDCANLHQKGVSDCLFFSLITVVIMTPHPVMVEISKKCVIGYLHSIEASFHVLFIQIFQIIKQYCMFLLPRVDWSAIQNWKKCRFLVSLTAVSPLTFKFTWIKIVISSAFHDLYRIYGFIEKNYPWNICA